MVRFRLFPCIRSTRLKWQDYRAMRNRLPSRNEGHCGLVPTSKTCLRRSTSRSFFAQIHPHAHSLALRSEQAQTDTRSVVQSHDGAVGLAYFFCALPSFHQCALYTQVRERGYSCIQGMMKNRFMSNILLLGILLFSIPCLLPLILSPVSLSYMPTGNKLLYCSLAGISIALHCFQVC